MFKKCKDSDELASTFANDITYLYKRLASKNMITRDSFKGGSRNSTDSGNNIIEELSNFAIDYAKRGNYFRKQLFTINSRYSIIVDGYSDNFTYSGGFVAGSSVVNYNNKICLFIYDFTYDSPGGIIRFYPSINFRNIEEFADYLVNNNTIVKSDHFKYKYDIYCTFDFSNKPSLITSVYGENISALEEYLKYCRYKVTSKQKIDTNITSYNLDKYNPNGRLVGNTVCVIKREKL
jgi:hypothetical protein